MELNTFILEAAHEHYRNLGGVIPAYCRYLSKNYNEVGIKEMISKIRNPEYEERINQHFGFNEVKEGESILPTKKVLYHDLDYLQKKFNHLHSHEIEYIELNGYNRSSARYTDRCMQLLKELGDTKEGNKFLNKFRELIFEETNLLD